MAIMAIPPSLHVDITDHIPDIVHLSSLYIITYDAPDIYKSVVTLPICSCCLMISMTMIQCDPELLLCLPKIQAMWLELSQFDHMYLVQNSK